jgi:hypothetical protein
MWVVLDVQPALIGGELGVARALSATVHAAAEHNLVLLENHPQTPSLYDCARNGTVRYLSESDALVASQLPLVINGKSEPIESVLSIPIIIKSNGGDCAHLSAWRLAELWRDDLRKFRQRRATCKVYWRSKCPYCASIVQDGAFGCPSCGRGFPRPSRVFHAEVRRSDGEVEDPSRMMGM